MSPTTLPSTLATPATSFVEPFGFPSWAYRKATWTSSRCSGGRK
jgi:hypothetical protein